MAMVNQEHDMSESLPSRHDTLFTFAASIGVQEVRHEEEPNFPRNVAIDLVLPSCSTERYEEEDEPRKANLEEHLKIKDTEHSRIELRAHEEIIDMIPGHAMLRATSQRGEVCDEGHQEAGDDGDAQKRPELIDDSVQLENPGKMKDTSKGNAGIERPDAGTVVG
jgi:hypothetical protein